MIVILISLVSLIVTAVATAQVHETMVALRRPRREDEADRLPPAPEIVPYAIWRDNLEAALSEMTLQNPTIDYDLVDSWTPYAKAKEAKRLSDPREHQREMISRAYRGSSFVAGGITSEVKSWGGQTARIDRAYRRSELPAVVIDTAEMVAATSDHDFNLACERAAVASMVGLESLPAAERYRRLLAEKGIIV